MQRKQTKTHCTRSVGKWIRSTWQSVMGKVFSVEPDVSWGSDQPGSLPPKNYKLHPLATQVVSAYTGPDEGITFAKSAKKEDGGRSGSTNGLRLSEPIAGARNWKMKHEAAYGMAVSLYDQPSGHQHPQGDPVADVFAVAVHPNSCVMALADGVNWGEKARLAARCAVRSVVESIHRDLYSPPNAFRHAALDTHSVTRIILSAFGDAQDAIIDAEATMTTLCVAVVVRLLNPEARREWAVVVVNVGDSYAYVYSPTAGRVREVTVGSHPEERDMRDSGGVLGPADGLHPDLANLTCSVTTIANGDVVFLLSDGVTDNFDPVVLRKAITPKDVIAWQRLNIPNPGLPILSREDREAFQLKKMEEALRQPTMSEQPRTAREVCAALIGYSTVRTDKRRKLLEAPENQVDLLPREKRREKKDELERTLKQLCGKLDHAAVVAFTAREIPLTSDERSAFITEQVVRDLSNF
eukprot:m.79584 g.79584  ORF g.79584 m.79584 type:complete len:467 (+) comp36140_c0_seq2:159-1559(+)